MRQLPTILALECASGPTSVALWHNGHILQSLEEMTPSAQSVVLMPMIEKAMKAAGLAYGDLSAVACSVGPGSFTGIRVGIAAATGICFAAKKPGIGITTLEATAYAGQKTGHSLMAVLRAGKGEWYYQPFSTRPLLTASGEMGVARPEAIASRPDTVWIGNVEHGGIAVLQARPTAAAVAELAATKKDPLKLVPIYIRPPDVSLPKKKL